MLFHHPAATAGSFQKPDVWLPDSQVRVVCRDGMTLCCKGGHNGESHNHNDVGSFMLYVDGEPQIVDAGNMTYTAKTFSAERYTLWNVRSAYHNLPMIGGKGAAARAGVRGGAGRCAAGRPFPGPGKGLRGGRGISFRRRTLELTNWGLTVRTDLCWYMNPGRPVSWVFMLRQRPCLRREDDLPAGIRMDVPEGLRYSAEEIPVTDARMARSFPGSLWRVVLTAAASRTQHGMDHQKEEPQCLTYKKTRSKPGRTWCRRPSS